MSDNHPYVGANRTIQREQCLASLLAIEGEGYVGSEEAHLMADEALLVFLEQIGEDMIAGHCRRLKKQITFWYA